MKKNGNNGNNTADKARIKELEDQLKENRIQYENLLNLKDKEIIELKNLIQTYENLKINNKLIDINKINETQKEKKNDFVLNFLSPYFSFGISCSEDDIFAFAEEKLYQKFEELRDLDNIFLVNGRRIKRFRTIKENKLESGMPITIQQVEGLDDKQYLTKIIDIKSNIKIEDNKIEDKIIEDKKIEDNNKIQDNKIIENKNKIENKPNGAPIQNGNKAPIKNEKKLTTKRDIKNTKKKK